jgi:glycosyltransferase involved in cell wall biosynthesis
MQDNMNILYLSPEHVSGTMELWKREHERRGHHCRYVTLFPNNYGFPEDICLHLPLQPDQAWLVKARQALYKAVRGPEGQDMDIPERPPFWQARSRIERLFFTLRDELLAPRIEKAIREHHLDDFDIVQLDQGAGFLRDARFIRRWKAMGKRIVTFYHGSDMRNRGIFPQVDRHADLRLTCELDLLYLDPRLRYLFLPVDTSLWTPREPSQNDDIIRISHGARNRFKGTDRIIEVVERLKQRYPVELVLIQGVSHDEAMRLKAGSDIAIDQITDAGGWGYGMSGIENLCLGIPTCTRLRDEYVEFIPDHPFVNVNPDNLETELLRLIEDEDYRLAKGREGREWVVRTHDIRAVADVLYGYYEELGWI